MKVCFIDEAGDLGLLNDPPQPNDQPVLVIGGLIVDTATLHDVTHAFLDLKSKYFPRPRGNSTMPHRHLHRRQPLQEQERQCLALNFHPEVWL